MSDPRPNDLLDAPPRSRRTVVVALGGADDDGAIARAAALSDQVGVALVGVHVTVPGVVPGPQLDEQRRRVTRAGGTTREVVAQDVAAALVAFCDLHGADTLVVGAGTTAVESWRRRRSVAADLATAGAGLELVVVPRTGARATAPTPDLARAHRAPIPTRQRWIAWMVCFVGLPLLTVVLSALSRHVAVGAALLLDLCLVLAAATLGGLAPGIVASVLAFALTNWFLTPPLHTLTVNSSENVVALSVFVIVTVVVSVLVDRAARQSREAALARSEAAALARSAATLVGTDDPLPELLEQLRATFGLRAAAVFEHTADGWWPTHQSGAPPLDPNQGTALDLAADGSLRLVVEGGEALPVQQLEILRAFADQLAVAVESRRLRTEAANADLLAEADALRSALLRAVSHDLRTPLAAIKASASGLLQPDVSFSEPETRQLLGDIEAAADRLERMVRDLLDMSRLQGGALQLELVPVALEEAVAAALGSVGRLGRDAVVDVSESLPLVRADRALLERAVANVVSNAMAWSPPGMPVVVEASLSEGSVDLRVVDRGPGVPVADRERIFMPFQRLGDRSRDVGAGLGLAIAQGFVVAMGGTIRPDDTPGGGLTMSIVLPISDVEPR